MEWEKLIALIQKRLAYRVKESITIYPPYTWNGYRYEERVRIILNSSEEVYIEFDSWFNDWCSQRGKHCQQYPKIRNWQEEINAKNQAVYTSLINYVNLSFGRIIQSPNPIIRAFGVLDSRTGIARLKKLHINQEHPLVKQFYYQRCEAEDMGLLFQQPPRIPSRPKKKISCAHPAAYAAAVEVLQKSKQTRKLPFLIKQIVAETIDVHLLQTPAANAIHSAFHSKSFKHVRSFEKLFLHLDKRSRLLHADTYIKGILAIAKDEKNWLRPISSWKPCSYNVDKQFSSLARHLFAKYEMPAFMDEAWLKDNSVFQKWYKHMGRGHNIRTIRGLPFPLTKRMAHYFLQAPKTLSIKEALRWGQVLALGGDRRLANAILETRLIRQFRDHRFWESVIRYFSRHPMLDLSHINPIVDYIWHQKYENQRVFVARGIIEQRGPAQPNFSMKGRNINTLLHAVNRWHIQLGREAQGGDLHWAKSNIDSFLFKEGSSKSNNQRLWKIEELLSSKELIDEGRKMHHCVATYAQACYRGRTSIWTMQSITEVETQKHLTLEVESKTKRIVQVRGRHNRYATDKEKKVIGRWVAQAGLSIARRY